MVNLRVLRDIEPVLEEQRASGVEIRRAQPSESQTIADWVRENINPNWGVVCEVALEQTPPNCFVAYRTNTSDETVDLSPDDIFGFACYDVVTKGVFGPSGVREGQHDTGVSTALMMSCLHAMAAEECVHAIIGWAGTTEGYST